MAKEIYYQRKNITVPAGTVAGNIITTDVTLNQDYETLESVNIHEVSGSEALNVGLRESGGPTIVERIHKNEFIASTAVPMSDRGKPLNINRPSGSVIVELEPNTTTAAETKIQVVFTLARYK